MFKNKKNSNKGFTLVELLVVIAIIGILAIVAIPSLFKNVDKAKSTQVVANVKALTTEILTEYANAKTDSQLESYFNEAKISELLEVTSATGELGETYSVEDNKGGDSKGIEDGKVFIKISCKDTKKIEIMANALGEPYIDKATELKYTVGKK